MLGITGLADASRPLKSSAPPRIESPEVYCTKPGLLARMAHIAVVDSDDEVVELLPEPSVGHDGLVAHPLLYPIEADGDAVCPPIELPELPAEGRPWYPVRDFYATRAAEILARHSPYCCADVARAQLEDQELSPDQLRGTFSDLQG